MGSCEPPVGSRGTTLVWSIEVSEIITVLGLLWIKMDICGLLRPFIIIYKGFFTHSDVYKPLILGPKLCIPKIDQTVS